MDQQFRVSPSLWVMMTGTAVPGSLLSTVDPRHPKCALSSLASVGECIDAHSYSSFSTDVSTNRARLRRTVPEASMLTDCETGRASIGTPYLEDDTLAMRRGSQWWPLDAGTEKSE